jgi:NAD-reducing hydrogenase large subunit
MNIGNRLETADHPERLRRVCIDPLTRVEGHGKVTLLLDDENRVAQARLHIVEFRGFERFIQGRPFCELPIIVQRLCGICPVSHHLAAAKACDQLVGVDALPPAAERVRRLMHFGQVLQSHALHFFYLASPDLLFGGDEGPTRRNVVGLIQRHPEIAERGVLLRKFGQEIIRATTGKRVHGNGAVPGGVNQSVSATDRDALRRQIGEIVEWAADAVALIRRIADADAEHHRRFAHVPANSLSLTGADGALELYDGGLRARDPAGQTIFDHADCHGYQDLIGETVKPWSYMKFPFLRALGPEDGWYRVGPLARVDNAERIDTPRAEQERQAFIADNGGQPAHQALATHRARLIELLHCAEAIARLLDDPLLGDADLIADGERRQIGIGVLEAPRGSLFHHYEIDDDGLVCKANLIVATTNNNQAMNAAIRQVAVDQLRGPTLTEALLNQVEVAIRAFDPCLSCATHTLGQMPLTLELYAGDGTLIDRRSRRIGAESNG